MTQIILRFLRELKKKFIINKSEYWFEDNFHSEIVFETLLPRFFIQSQHIFETLKPLNCFESNFTNRFKILQFFSEIISWKIAKQAQSRSRQQFMCVVIKKNCLAVKILIAIICLPYWILNKERRKRERGNVSLWFFLKL